MEDELVDRAFERIGAYRDRRTHDQVLSATADEDLRLLAELPQRLDAELAIGWLHYCRYLSLGPAGLPDFMKALEHFYPLLPHCPDQIPLGIISLNRSGADQNDAASPRHAAALVLANIEPRVEALRTTVIEEPFRVVLADLERALSQLPLGEPECNLALLNLAMALRIRYLTFSDAQNLDAAIDAARTAVNTSQLDDLYLVSNLNTLAASLCDRFEISRHVEDIQEALATYESALSYTSPAHADRGILVTGFASALELAAGEQAYTAESLKERTALLRSAVVATPLSHVRYVDIVQPLARALLELYKVRDDERTLREAGDVVTSALEVLGTADDPDNRTRLAVLEGRVTLEQAQRTGDFSQWQAAESALAHAIEALPPGHIYRPAALQEHGLLLMDWYSRTRHISALDRALHAFETALDLMHQGDADRPRVQSLLGFALAQKAQATADVKAARHYSTWGVDAARAAVSRDGMPSTTVPVDPEHAELWSNLTTALTTAADIHHDRALHDEAVAILRAIHQNTDTPRRRRMAAHNLAVALIWHVEDDARGGFERPPIPEPSQRVPELDEAAGLLESVLEATPAEHGDRNTIELVLAGCLTERWRCTPGDVMDRTRLVYEAIECYRRVAARSDTSIHQRVAAWHGAGRVLAEAGHWEQAHTTLSAAVGMLPELVSAAAVRSDQEFSVSRFFALASDAAACALQLGHPQDAVRLLEQGRGILVTQRSDADADAVTQVSRSLARGESLVFLNASRLRCDALLLNSSGVRCIPLPELDWPDLVQQTGGMLYCSKVVGSDVLEDRDRAEQGFELILDWLWHVAVRPVFAELSRLGDSTSELPRIWWCPTGLLAFFPLHAAGPLGPQGYRALDLMVSSYVPTARALVEARRGPAGSTPVRLLAVALSETPESVPLPGVRDERQAARAAVSTGVDLEGRTATRSRILAELPAHSWLYFGGHGYQDPTGLGHGGLVPYDHLESGLVSIEDIRALDLRGADLAVVSACDTARGAMGISDETVHFAGSLQAAGFRHVVASQWSADDDTATAVTEHFFAALKAGGLRSDRAALALHESLHAVREAGVHVSLWAPYVHFGP